MKYKCVIFDCDGVLVDSENISLSVIIKLAKEHSINLDKATARALFTGSSLQSCFRYMETISGRSLPDDFEKMYRKRSSEAFQSELKAIDGIYELIDKIDVPFCVASNGPQHKIIQNLTITKLIDKFEHNVFSAYDINAWKPDPSLFLHAAKRMGFTPKECVVIEDSEAGVIAAIRGGFSGICLY